MLFKLYYRGLSSAARFGILEYYCQGTILLEAQNLDVRRMIWFGLPPNCRILCFNIPGTASSLFMGPHSMMGSFNCSKLWCKEFWSARPASLCLFPKPHSCRCGHMGRVHPCSIPQAFRCLQPALQVSISLSSMGWASLVPSDMSDFPSDLVPNSLVLQSPFSEWVFNGPLCDAAESTRILALPLNSCVIPCK